MPIPKPKKGESKEKFIDRCMSNSVMKKEYPDNNQRLAVCGTTWKNKDKKSLTNHEIRVIAGEMRVHGMNSSSRLEGHAAVFNKFSEDLGGFREKIAPGAFKESLRKSDVRALVNHDGNLVLGRNTAGTLTLKEDSEGLFFSVDLPDTQVARDIKVSIDRGDIDQCSFGFIVEADTWEEKDNGDVERTINKVRQLLDVSVVTFPAYPDTSVAATRMDEWRKITMVDEGIDPNTDPNADPSDGNVDSNEDGGCPHCNEQNDLTDGSNESSNLEGEDNDPKYADSGTMAKYKAKLKLNELNLS